MSRDHLYNSKLSIIKLYKEQLKTFNKLGIGNYTEFNTKISQELIDVTEKRLSQLSSAYTTNKREYNKKEKRRVKNEKVSAR